MDNTDMERRLQGYIVNLGPSRVLELVEAALRLEAGARESLGLDPMKWLATETAGWGKALAEHEPGKAEWEGFPKEQPTDTDRRRLEFDHLRLQGDLLRAQVASEQARSEGMRLQNEQMRIQNEQGRLLLQGNPTTVGGAGTR